MFSSFPIVNRSDEPAELRTQSKNQIYSLLKTQFMLPEKDSRGVTRSYLISVYKKQFYRVERSDLLAFESKLTLQEQVKNSTLSVSQIVIRMDALLRQLGEAPLGFSEFNCPDEQWCWRIARFLDRANLLNLYKSPVEGSAVPDIPAGRV